LAFPFRRYSATSPSAFEVISSSDKRLNDSWITHQVEESCVCVFEEVFSSAITGNGNNREIVSRKEIYFFIRMLELLN
jgi:hypothetical protein